MDMAIKKNGDAASVSEAAQSAAQAGSEVAQATAAVFSKGLEDAHTVLKTGLSDATARFEKTQAEVNSKVEKAVKTAEEIVAFSQGNVEALVKSGQIWAAGLQDIGKQVAAASQAQLDKTVSALKALASVKSLKEAVDLHSGLARSSLESAVSETGKLTDASFKLAEQTLAPITARITLAVEKFGRPA